ncbi:hypothetical protein [Kitasatospora sp. NPDC085879]|uniref:hypothetical protein n=1 Tax=Kitasatospora sp. NPDC085879 TaxID=3154769 RepID=UPI00342599C7
MPLDRATRNGPRRPHRPLVPLLLAAAALTGCSSSGGSPQAGDTAAPAGTSASATAGPSGATSTEPSVAPATPAAPPSRTYGARPDEACSVLTFDQVAQAVGTPDRFVGTHPDPASDGSPVWGCTWGSHLSYVSLDEVTAHQFAAAIAGTDTTSTVVPGIGDQAVLARRRDGSRPALAFMAGMRYYRLEVIVDRGETGPANGAREATAARSLAALAAKALMR